MLGLACLGNRAPDQMFSIPLSCRCDDTWRSGNGVALFCAHVATLVPSESVLFALSY